MHTFLHAYMHMHTCIHGLCTKRHHHPGVSKQTCMYECTEERVYIYVHIRIHTTHKLYTKAHHPPGASKNRHAHGTSTGHTHKHAHTHTHTHTNYIPKCITLLARGKTDMCMALQQGTHTDTHTNTHTHTHRLYTKARHPPGANKQTCAWHFNRVRTRYVPSEPKRRSFWSARTQSTVLDRSVV